VGPKGATSCSVDCCVLLLSDKVKCDFKPHTLCLKLAVERCMLDGFRLCTEPLEGSISLLETQKPMAYEPRNRLWCGCL
jgi:hypothetical protein